MFPQWGISQAITRHANKEGVLWRSAPGLHDQAGKWIDGELEEIPIKFNKQAPKPEELEVLSSGQREEDLIKIFTEHNLKVTDSKAKTKSDVLEFEGRKYTFIKSRNYGPYSIGIGIAQ